MKNPKWGGEGVKKDIRNIVNPVNKINENKETAHQQNQAWDLIKLQVGVVK
jgi:hypothetical protein